MFDIPGRSIDYDDGGLLMMRRRIMMMLMTTMMVMMVMRRKMIMVMVVLVIVMKVYHNSPPQIESLSYPPIQSTNRSINPSLKLYPHRCTPPAKTRRRGAASVRPVCPFSHQFQSPTSTRVGSGGRPSPPIRVHCWSSSTPRAGTVRWVALNCFADQGSC